jgi:hypothetical protein
MCVYGFVNDWNHKQLWMNCDVDGLAAAQSSFMHDILLLHPPAETTG